MTRNDKIRAFPQLMTKLLVTYHQRERNELETVLQLEAYFEALEPYKLEEVAAAVRAAIREPDRVFMPAPGELIGLILQERRRRRVEEQMHKALPGLGELTDAEAAEVRQMLDGLRAKLDATRQESPRQWEKLERRREYGRGQGSAMVDGARA